MSQKLSQLIAQFTFLRMGRSSVYRVDGVLSALGKKIVRVLGVG